MVQALTAESKPATAALQLANLPAELKNDLFCQLFRELIAHQGETGIIPITTPDGEFLGTVVPANVEQQRAEAHFAELPAEVREKLLRPLPFEFDPAAVLTEAELESHLKGEHAPLPG